MWQDLWKFIQKIPKEETTLYKLVDHIDTNCKKMQAPAPVKSGVTTGNVKDLNKKTVDLFGRFAHCVDGMTDHPEEDFSTPAKTVMEALKKNRKSGGNSYAASTYHFNAVLLAMDSLTGELESLRLSSMANELKTMKTDVEQLRNERVEDNCVDVEDISALLFETRKDFTKLFNTLDSIEDVNKETMKPIIDGINGVTSLYRTQVKTKITRKTNAKKKTKGKGTIDTGKMASGTPVKSGESSEKIANVAIESVPVLSVEEKPANKISENSQANIQESSDIRHSKDNETVTETV